MKTTNDTHPIDEQDSEQAAMAAFESDPRYCPECERWTRVIEDDGFAGPCVPCETFYATHEIRNGRYVRRVSSEQGEER